MRRGLFEWMARTVRRVLSHRGLPFNLDDAGSPRWDERAQVAAALLASHLDALAVAAERPLRIADFGAGTERLDRVLAATLGRPYAYVPFDLIPQSERVRQLDVERTLPVEDYDVVFCLGLLEYIKPLETLLERLATRYPALVVSYAVYDTPNQLTRRERRRRGWLTHYERAEIEAEFARQDLAIADVAVTHGGRTAVWLLRTGASGPGSLPKTGVNPEIIVGCTEQREHS